MCNRIVWTLPLHIGEWTEIAVPYTHEALKVGFDEKGEPCLWVEIDADADPKTYRGKRFYAYRSDVRILDHEYRYFDTLTVPGKGTYHVYTNANTVRTGRR